MKAVKQIKNTPFTIVEENEKSYYITIGTNAVLQRNSVESCEKEIKNKSWELIINTMYVFNNEYNKIKESKK